MPQLNPAPWLMILAFSWLIFLTILPTKIVAHTLPNSPIVENTKALKPNPWAWPWH